MTTEAKQDDTNVVEVFKNLLDNLVINVAVKPEDVVKEAKERGFQIEGDDTRAQIESLRKYESAELDGLANGYINSNTMLAALQGFATGVPGVLALPVTIPADLAGTATWFVRAFSGAMLSYGYYFDSASEEGRALFLLELATATGLQSINVKGRQLLTKELTERLGDVATRQAVVDTVASQIAKKLGLQVAKGALLTKGIPIIGGVFGAGLNIVSIQSLGKAARRYFRKLYQEDKRRREKFSNKELQEK